MSKAQYRSRSYKRIKVKRATGVKIKYKKKRTNNSYCVCGRKITTRANRPFSNLCTKCMRRLIIETEGGAL